MKELIERMIIDDNGKVNIDIVGELKSGQYVHGTDSIRIIQPRR